MTVSGLTMTSADRQSAQAPDNHAQNKRSATVNFGRFLVERRSTPIWWRNARISTWRAARERKTESRLVRNGDKVLHIGLPSHSWTHDLREIEVSEKDSLLVQLRSRTAIPANINNIPAQRAYGVILLNEDNQLGSAR